ncbi:uncharacterized protein EV420DRAFT_1551982 [Desarmillaria tabescens]|uniref:Uncharacterized protein n=1 Tax=Armillaria tabescens TaxID=1929756 RepID=A0AA39KC83_ARMTA|nr:uncharacterized protein EV420DRAFT_1551982 [Desarmillaria tabescens]KAK0457181.1 hypothetical protein EV420DRAFT_1551982 [Desarmillaria tabescens]
MTLTLSPIIKPQPRSLSLSPRSLSPSSIPSSPSSVHSSSSAIFERDIEPISPPLPPAHQNPHRIPRAKATESSVPSVLDSAAAILVDSHTSDVDVEVLTPAASPLVSRSPSPRASLLLTTSSLGPPSPTSIARELSPAPSPKILTKRLSFLSYSDLLASNPTNTVMLSSLTLEPPTPPHILTLTDGGTLKGFDEWEKEGLGMGLEERLEAVSGATSPMSIRSRPVSVVRC